MLDCLPCFSYSSHFPLSSPHGLALAYKILWLDRTQSQHWGRSGLLSLTERWLYVDSPRPYIVHSACSSIRPYIVHSACISLRPYSVHSAYYPACPYSVHSACASPRPYSVHSACDDPECRPVLRTQRWHSLCASLHVRSPYTERTLFTHTSYTKRANTARPYQYVGHARLSRERASDLKILCGPAVNEASTRCALTTNMTRQYATAGNRSEYLYLWRSATLTRNQAADVLLPHTAHRISLAVVMWRSRPGSLRNIPRRICSAAHDRTRARRFSLDRRQGAQHHLNTP